MTIDRSRAGARASILAGAVALALSFAAQAQDLTFDIGAGELKAALTATPPEAAADAAKLADRVAQLAEEATADGPDGDLVRDLGETVKRAAGKVAHAVPGVMTLAAAIVELVAAIVG